MVLTGGTGGSQQAEGLWPWLLALVTWFFLGYVLANQPTLHSGELVGYGPFGICHFLLLFLLVFG